jgi:hypothetical protein
VEASNRARLHSEQGVALLVALLATVLMSALAAGLALGAATETMIAANFRVVQETQHAAEAVLELAIAELATVDDWSAVLGGGRRSAFADGTPRGIRHLPGVTVNLDQVVGLANCARAGGCTESEMTAVTADRPWGANNPRWTLFLFAPLEALGTGADGACCYVTALVGDDPYENDANPRLDGFAEVSPGADVLLVRGEAFGTHGSHGTRVATVSRRAGSLRVVSWRTDVP